MNVTKTETPEFVEATENGIVYFECTSDSMDDGSRRAICKGDILQGRFVPREEWSQQLNAKGHITAVVNKGGVAIAQAVELKSLLSGEETDFVTCRVFNPEVDEFVLNKSDINELYDIVKIVDRVICPDVI